MLTASDVDTDGLVIRAKFHDRDLPARIVGETLAIDGHGQPVDKRSPVSVLATSDRLLKWADIVRKYLLSRGYEHVRVSYV